MITKERLEELIKQDATIYAVDYEHRMEQIKLVARVMGVSVDKYNKIHDCEPMLYSQLCGIFRDICPISWLFETKEEAEWYKEFGCITRAERLELPTWDEIDKEYNKSKYKRKKFGTYEIVKFVGKKTENDYVLEIFVDNYTKKFICLSCFVRQPLTKENYTLACRKAKELFLGDENE